jgi:hypothetical protein
MNTQTSQQSPIQMLSAAAQAAKVLHRSDKRFRFAVEVGAIGFVLLVGMSLFGGSGGRSNSAGSASYSPPAQNAPASGSPAITQSQLQSIKAQTGGNLINTVPVAPLVVKPVMTDSEVQVETSASDPSDPFTFTEKPKGPKPVYHESK